MKRTKNCPILARFRFQGPDKKGIIATITGFFFLNKGNILDIDQRILDDHLVMNMLVDLSDATLGWDALGKALKTVVSEQLGMNFKAEKLGEKTEKKLALLVTAEDHCPERIIADIKKKLINGSISVMIGNQTLLADLAKKHRIPFHFVPSENKKKHETEVLKILDRHQVDLVVLARYMQILSPEFVFRYEGRIINIHPSLLPAFPGPRSYHQAFNKGVDYVGVTAHFVTTDLDEGPIICQEAFRVNRTKDAVEDYIKKGRVMEAKALSQAVKLFCDDMLTLRRGKVLIGKDECRMTKITKEFYK